MKGLILSIFLVVNPITFVADRNYYVIKAEQAFQTQQYVLASQHYSYVVKDLEWKKENIALNLAHSYFLAKKYELAATEYTQLSQSTAISLASVALNQLGYLAAMNQDFEKSLQYFQEALVKYPQNYEARYNYELIAKILQRRGKKPQNKPEKKNNTAQDKTKDKQKGNGQGEQNTDDSKNENKYNPQKLKDLQLNKEKAEAILKAIRNQESQYIQQQQQKKKLQNNTNPNLPDW
jgi:hypothetical protein